MRLCDYIFIGIVMSIVIYTFKGINIYKDY